MARLLIDSIEIPDETLETIEAHRQSMPMAEFLSYCIIFGAGDIRDSYQQERRDYTARTMSERLTAYQRKQADLFSERVTDTHVVKFAAGPKDKE